MLTEFAAKPVVSVFLSGAIASNSSINTNEINFFSLGHPNCDSHAALEAHVNHSSIFFSVSPTYFPFKSPGDGAKNNTPTLGSVFCSSFTAALTIYVLPVPGGP